MELKEYVTQTLVQICQGVSDAMSECSQLGAIVNPSSYVDVEGSSYIPKEGSFSRIGRRVQIIEIGAALTASEESSHGRGLGLSVSFFKGEAGKDSSSKVVNNNYVHFSVPVAMPATD